MNASFTIKLLIIFSVAFSLTALTGPLAGNRTSLISLAHANTQPCQTVGASGSCSEFWYPAGPAMDTELVTIFTDETAEFNNIQSQSPSIDFTDWPLTQSLVPGLTSNPNFLVSSPVSSHSYFEIEFMLANNFWGVNMNYGNDANGVQIRQGISHLIDKTQFVANDPNIGGQGSPIDNPLPPSNGGLPSANPCSWDASFHETSTACTVGGAGGLSYHLATATGGPNAWSPGLGTSDFCAAAQHFINAGIATGKSSTTCVLTGLAPAVSQNTVSFFIRSDDPARLDLGNGLAQEICALFTGSFNTSCSPYLTSVDGPITAFPGFTTSNNSVNLSWQMYTAGFTSVYPFDSSLYFGYNSRFVSGIPSIQTPTGSCTADAVPSFSAGNYIYLCNPAYDNMTARMEFAPCITSPNDPKPGSTSNSPGGNCTGTNQLSAVSAGVQSEDLFGQGAYTIPVFSTIQQFAYLNGWSRAINNEGTGIPNYFTWLNTRNPSPTQSGTIRQGFKQPTRSLNPYIASTAWDFFIIGNIYDSLDIANPLSNGQIINWMGITSIPLANTALGYSPPTGTILSYRFTLRNDVYWQDGRPVTPWDVKYTILTLQATGAFQGSVLAPVSGVTVVNTHQFDINVKAVGPFTLLSITSVTIIPGRYWSVCSGTAWDGYINSGTVPDSCMVAHPNKIIATFDPLSSGILIGSGPWECKSSTGTLGIGCSSTGTQNPPPGSSYTLTRFGKGLAPASSTTSIYFRSNGDLALWIWSQENDVNPIAAVSAVSPCFGQAIGFGSCAHWQKGIGASGPGVSPCAPTVSGCVGINQVSAVELRYNLNWVNPKNWATDAPLGIGALPPVLYEGSVTLNPCSVDPVNGYDC